MQTDKRQVLILACTVAIFASVARGDEHGGVRAQSVQEETFQLPSDARHTLWIPSDYQVRGKQIDVLFDFHGSPRLVRSSTRQAGLNCVVINVKYAGLSSVYRVPFSENRQLFATILRESLDALRADARFANDAEWGKLAVSSFSAGFGAVREVLKTQGYFDRIDGLYMVDSLYCGYEGDGTKNVVEGVVDSGLMSDFVRFARASAAGKKVMIITHCNGPTPGYASTRETADYLLEKLDLQAEAVEIELASPRTAAAAAGVLKLYRKAARQGFSIYGSTGPSETDHVEHLKQMAYWLPALPLAKRE